MTNENVPRIGDVRTASVQCADSDLIWALKKQVLFAIAFPRYIYGLVTGYFYDFMRYYRSASKGYEAACAGKPRYTELKSWIAADAHKIEKALSLREPRPGFGQPVVRRLIENIEVFHKAFGVERTTRIAVNVLVAYCDFNDDHDYRNEFIGGKVAALSRSVTAESDLVALEGGVFKANRESIEARAKVQDIEAFFESRHSVRNFAARPVSRSTVEAAIRMAQRTPSVCNRQSWKVYAYLEDPDKSRVLECQTGNRGFGEQAAGVLVVTSDMATFFSFAERNQAWIDGGMFAMSVVYALHALGVASCCLNWSVDIKTDRTLRKVSQIPRNEAVIMMIAIGYLPDELYIPHSVRKPLSEVLVVGRETKPQTKDT